MKNRIDLFRLCPTEQEWRALLTRDLPAGRIAEMESHLDRCRTCLAIVDALMPPLPRGLTELVLEAGRPGGGGPGGYWRRWADVRPGAEAAAQPADDLKPFERAGAYESRGRIGTGGMGEVYKAWEVALERHVAIKVLPARARVSAAAVARLKREARRLAKLEHPNIVRLYTADERDGVPFFTMELVCGPTLAASLRTAPPTPRRAAELVKLIAEAVHHAHRQGVFHLDLKPGNILMTPEGVPKVGDFGLSRALDGDLAPLRDRAAGTDEYMAPEQWVGDPEGLREPTDVYGLGAILYELLTGRPPFARSAERAETSRRVLFDEASFHAEHHRGVPSDLKTICLRCLRKRPEDRYATAQELAGRLDLFLRGHPVEECSWARRALYLVRRRRAIVAAACAGLLILAAMLAMSLASRTQRQSIDAQSRFATGQRWAAEGRLTDGVALMQDAIRLLPAGERPWHDYFSRATSARKSRLVREMASLPWARRVTSAAASVDGRLVLVGDESGGAVFWDWRAGRTRALTRGSASRAINAVAFNRSAALCASGGEDEQVRIWDVRSGELVTMCQLGYYVRRVAFLKDGEFFVTGTGDPRKPLRRWRATEGRATEVPIEDSGSMFGQTMEITVSDAADRFAVVSFPARCTLWDSTTGARVADLADDAGRQGASTPIRTAFSVDGSLLAVVGPALTLHDARTGELRETVDAGRWKDLYAVGFRDDGGLTLVGDAGQAIVIRRSNPARTCWDEVPIERPSHGAEVATVTRSGLLLAGLATKTVRLSMPPPMDMIEAEVSDLDLGMARIAVPADASLAATLVRPAWKASRRPASGGKGATEGPFRSRLQVWDTRSLRPLTRPVDLNGSSVAQTVAVSPAGGRIAVGCVRSAQLGGRAHVLIGRLDGEELRLEPLGMHESDVMAAAFVDGGRMLLTGSSIVPGVTPGEFIGWSVDERRVLWKSACAAGVVAIAAAPDGTVAAVGGTDGAVRIQSLGRPDASPLVLDLEGGISGLSFSGDGTKLAVALTSGRVAIFERSKKGFTRVAQLEHPGTFVSSLVFGPGDRVLYVKGVEEVYRWDATVWKPIAPAISCAVKILDFHLASAPRGFLAVTRNGRLVRMNTAFLE